jgi:SEC-C motif domain protein
MHACPCGSGKDFDTCCGPILAGAPAPTAEALMRSRYTAHVKQDIAHLERTLSAEQRKSFDEAAARRWSQESEWLGLSISRTEQGGEGDETGLVEFTARFKIEGGEQEHFEQALFSREEGRWVYAGQLNGPGVTVRRESPKIGRNDPCPCGTGKKYKKCCGA